MGESSIIARRLPDGHVQFGWSGEGGNFQHVGRKLLDWYNTPDMVAYLFSLIAAIARCKVQWTWLDRLRWLKKSVYAKELENAGGRYLWADEAKKYAAMEADKFSDTYIEEHLRFINSFQCSSENDFWSLIPNEVLAEKLEVPADMAVGLKRGRKYGLEDFQALYRDVGFRAVEMTEEGHA